MTNQVYSLAQGDRCVIVKVYEAYASDKNPLYPNVAEAEINTLRYLASSTFTPLLIDSWQQKVDGRVIKTTLVYEYLEGVVWQLDTVAVARLLSQLHDPAQVVPPPWLRQLPLSAHEVCCHADTILQQVHDSDVNGLQKLRPMNPSTEEATSQSFVHGDCWAGNFIQNKKELWLIDWQCPGVGDAVEDIANFLSPGMMSFCREQPLSKAERQAFFETYENQAVIQRYQRDAASWHWRLACYYLYRRETLKVTQPELSLGYKRALTYELEYLQTLL
jgi:aminoglycoside phosphotransferase (APT) family kinase protein